MKKTLLTIGIILLVIAVISFAVSIFYHWAHRSVLDGSAELYSRLTRRYRTFLYIGIGMALLAAASLVISFITKNR